MSNWIAINEAAVRTGKITVFVDAMQARATADGEADPLPEYIADVSATLRAAISVGNDLDFDPTKIPSSLKGLALRLITRRIKDYLEQPLSTDELKQADDDRSYLNRIIDDKIRFEAPDTPGGGDQIQSAGGYVDTINSVPRLTGRVLQRAL